MAHLNTVFKANGYTSQCIKPLLRKNYKHRQLQSSATEGEHKPPEEEKRYLCLPYVRGVSERIDRVCKSIDSVKIKTSFKPVKTLTQVLNRVKNKVPNEQRKGVVYEVPCEDCEQSYVGETGRTLKKRIVEHKAAVKKEDNKNGIAVHVKNTKHHIDWDGARVISNEMQYWQRRIVEAISIQTRPQTMNLDCGLKLNDTWQSVLNITPSSPCVLYFHRVVCVFMFIVMFYCLWTFY